MSTNNGKPTSRVDNVTELETVALTESPQLEAGRAIGPAAVAVS